MYACVCECNCLFNLEFQVCTIFQYKYDIYIDIPINVYITISM